MTMTSNQLTAPTLSNGLCIHTLSCRRTNWSAHLSWRTEQAAETSLGENTPLVGGSIHKEDKPAILDRAREIITKRFSKVNFAKLGQIGFSKKGDDAKIVLFGPKGGESDIFKKNDSDLLKSLTDRFKNSLGSKAEDIIAEDNKSIREEKQLRGRKELPPITNEPMMRCKIWQTKSNKPKPRLRLLTKNMEVRANCKDWK